MKKKIDYEKSNWITSFSSDQRIFLLVRCSSLTIWLDLSQKSVRNTMIRESSFHLLKSSKGSPYRTLQRFRDSGEFSDVSLVSDDGDMYPAHKMVLASHSQKLDRILTQLQPGQAERWFRGWRSLTRRLGGSSPSRGWWSSPSPRSTPGSTPRRTRLSSPTVWLFR